jgi:hypothetical protein
MFSHFFGWTAAIINNSNINEVHTGGGQFFSFSGGRCVGGMIVFCYSHSPTAASLRHRNLKERGGRASLSLSLFLSFPLASLRFGLDFKFTLQEKPSTSIGQIFMVSKMLSCSLSLFPWHRPTLSSFEVLLFLQHFSVRTYQTPQTRCISSFSLLARVIQISHWNFISWMFVFILIIGCMAPLHVHSWL